jgi:hypothetical protein
MSEGAPVDPETMKLGLLLEAAQSHQDLVGDSLKQLRAHTQGLDAVVRDEIRRAVIAELAELVEHCNSAAQAMRSLSRVVQLRSLWSGAVLAILPGAAVSALIWWWLPTPARIASLRAQEQQLSENVQRLTQQGARIDLRRCGSGARLCVRVDRGAPAFGQHGEYLIVENY